MRENELAGVIIGCGMRVHTALGPGLLESVYRECLFFELKEAGVSVGKEIPLPLVYKEVKLECAYRVDLQKSTESVKLSHFSAEI